MKNLNSLNYHITRRKFLWITSMVSIGTIIGCADNDSTPNRITKLGIEVYISNGKTYDDKFFNELDQHFLEVIDGLNYGPVPSDFRLFIMRTICDGVRENGKQLCYFLEPMQDISIMAITDTEADLAEIDFQNKGFTNYSEIEIAARKLAGMYDPPKSLFIHLWNGQWTIEQSAYRHEIIHYAKYWYGKDDWARHDGDGWDLQ